MLFNKKMIQIFREYNDLLKILKWPFCGINVSSMSPPLPETMTKFKLLTEYLFHLQLPYPSNSQINYSVTY